MPGADEKVRVVAVDDDEREVALELGEREPNRVDEIALVVALDEVGDGLRVGLGGEGVALGRETRAELPVVLDDPVEHDRDASGVAAGQRVRVLLGDRSVRRPTRVPEPGRGGGAVRRPLDQVLERADGTHVREPAVLQKSDSARVVPAVLQALEALQEQRLRLTRSDVSDDSTHDRAPWNA